MVRLTFRACLPGKNWRVSFDLLKYCPGSCAYSERVWQECVGQDMLVDVGLTWRVSPEVSEGRASRTTARARVRTPWWEIIVGKLLKAIQDTGMLLVITWCFKKASSITRI